MILIAVPPTPGQVVVGVGAVLAGSLIACCSAHLARRSGNWLLHIGTVGGLLIVAGVVGQRTSVDGAAIGPWDAAITIPVLGLRIDPVTAAGVIVCLVGLVIGLLLERVPDEALPRPPLVHRRLEDDDTV